MNVSKNIIIFLKKSGLYPDLEELVFTWKNMIPSIVQILNF